MRNSQTNDVISHHFDNFQS